MPKSYDSKSYELAEYFLADEPGATEADRDLLATDIQRAIEDFLEYELPQRIKARAELAT